MNSQIRPAEKTDVEALSVLGATTFTQKFGHLYDPKNLAAFLKENHNPAFYERVIGDAEWRLWVVQVDDGSLIGFCLAGPCDLPVPDMPASSGEVHRIYLLDDAQGSGLGSKLLELSLDWLEESFDHVYLSVFAENFGAQRLYTRYGFEKIAEFDFMVGDHADLEWIMERRSAPRD